MYSAAVQLSSWISVLIVGCLGGAFLELLKWYGMRESAEFPTYTKSFRYWAVTGAMIIAGGVVAMLYGYQDVNAILAFNLGASAPAIIRSLATPPSPPEKSPTTRSAGRAEGRDRPSIRQFLAGW